MFKDTKEGTTHYQNDGCGEPAHNNPILKAHLEGKELLKKVLAESSAAYGTSLPNPELFSFLTTYGINLLKAAKEAGPGEKTIYPITNRENEAQIWRDGNVRGFNSCRSSFTSAIDEGIKGIEKGEK